MQLSSSTAAQRRMAAMKSRAPRTGSSQRAAVAVGDVLRDVLQRVDPEQHLRAYRIWSFWGDEVGNGIARRAQPAGFRNGILFVTVATHSWMQELQFMKDQIRDRLNLRLGAHLVRDIFFVSGSVEVEAPVAEPIPPTPIPAAVVAPPTAVALPPFADPELAAAFRRVVAARARRVAATQKLRGRMPKPR
jgi:Dna[CI] antecedent DciA-like protein